MAAGHWPRWAESGVRPAVRRVDASEAVRRTAHSTDRWGGSEARPWGIEASGGDLNLAGSGALAAYGERRDQKARRPLAETRSPATGAKPSHQRPLLVGPIKPPTGTCPARRVTDCPWPDVPDGTRPSTPSSANRGSVPRDLSGCTRRQRGRVGVISGRGVRDDRSARSAPPRSSSKRLRARSHCLVSGRCHRRDHAARLG